MTHALWRRFLPPLRRALDKLHLLNETLKAYEADVHWTPDLVAIDSLAILKDRPRE